VRRLALMVVCLGALALPANAAATTLHARVASLTIFELTNDQGAAVTRLDPGTYTIVVTDSTGAHTFHLVGPNVDKTTGPGGGFTGTVTWEVTVTDGIYEFYCDIHPGVMFGSFSVGNVLSVERTGTGTGKVTSPGGVDCGLTCSIGMPLSSSVTLTATPLFGSEFKGWSGGGCSGTAPCTVFSSPGLTTVSARFDWASAQPPPPPPPAVPPSARVTRVTVARVNGRRVVRVRLAVVRHTAVTVRLRRAGKTLATVEAHATPGTRIVTVRVPRTAKAGTCTVAVRIADSASGDARSVTRFVKLPAP